MKVSNVFYAVMGASAVATVAASGQTQNSGNSVTSFSKGGGVVPTFPTDVVVGRDQLSIESVSPEFVQEVAGTKSAKLSATGIAIKVVAKEQETETKQSWGSWFKSWVSFSETESSKDAARQLKQEQINVLAKQNQKPGQSLKKAKQEARNQVNAAVRKLREQVKTQEKARSVALRGTHSRRLSAYTPMALDACAAPRGAVIAQCDSFKMASKECQMFVSFLKEEIAQMTPQALAEFKAELSSTQQNLVTKVQTYDVATDVFDTHFSNITATMVPSDAKELAQECTLSIKLLDAELAKYKRDVVTREQEAAVAELQALRQNMTQVVGELDRAKAELAQAKRDVLQAKSQVDLTVQDLDGVKTLTWIQSGGAAFVSTVVVLAIRACVKNCNARREERQAARDAAYIHQVRATALEANNLGVPMGAV